ncbi:tRNA pseudouridine synthase-like 1 [Blomia tropicalis]|nr:tRNA pseudouridine synthase-like 1 [Blomia tropicalis]
MSYIGTNYKGVQRLTQRLDEDAEDGTIQCAIERAMVRGLRPVYGARLALSSRTDAGVHAYQNYANCDLTHPLAETLYKPSFITDATNRILQENGHEIIILESLLVPSYFHSRVNAKWRSYVYRLASIRNHPNDSSKIYNNLRTRLPVSQVNRCHVVGFIDLDLIQQCIEMLKGEHDFASFSTRDTNQKDKSTIKNIEQLELRRCQPLTDFEMANNHYSMIDFFELHIKSKSFLYNQVRRMVTAILDVGMGRLKLSNIEKMLSVPNWHHPLASTMVPACGLYLVEVGYDPNDIGYLMYQLLNKL